MEQLCGLCHVSKPSGMFYYAKQLRICNTCCNNIYIRCIGCGVIDSYPTDNFQTFEPKRQICKACKLFNTKQTINTHFCAICKLDTKDKKKFSYHHKICDTCCETVYVRKCSNCPNIKTFDQFAERNTKCKVCVEEITIEIYKKKIIEEQKIIDENKDMIAYEKNKKYPNKDVINAHKEYILDSKDQIEEYKQQCIDNLDRYT